MSPRLAAHDSAIYIARRAVRAHRRACTSGATSSASSAEAAARARALSTSISCAPARSLGAAAQPRYAEIMERLAELTTRFGQNVLADEASTSSSLRDEADLAGLPDFVRAAAREAGARARHRRRLR